MARVLLVEDDPALSRGLSFNLEREGHEVLALDSGEEALARTEAEAFDLLVLDLGLPDIDGTEVLRRLREGSSILPVLCLTARADEADVVMGFELGADDYVTKPFALAELLVRVQALLRRASWSADRATETPDAERLRLGRVEVDLQARLARHEDGRSFPLTPTETEILAFLAARPGEALERGRLLEELWGLSRRDATRTLDNHVARLRRKIEDDPAAPRFLLTVHGVGYRFDPTGTAS